MKPVDRVEKEMAKAGGTLEGKSMAGTFDIMRANDLIFNYVVSNWLLGQDPPVFDILAWNDDSTKMPGAMHAFYLRNFYVRNLLAQGQLEIAGQTIDLSTIKSNAYVVSAKKRSHRAVEVGVQVHATVVRDNAIHPQQRRAYRWNRQPAQPEVVVCVRGRQSRRADDWMSVAKRTSGSWWVDWAKWSAEHAGELTSPPPIGSAAQPVLGPAPGTYVFT